MTTRMPRWAESIMRKNGISEPPSAGVVPDWLRAEVEKTPLWYIIREAKEIRRAHPYLLVEELRKQPQQWREILSTLQPATHRELAQKIEDLERHYQKHDAQIQAVFDAIRQLLEPAIPSPKRRIGFTT